MSNFNLLEACKFANTLHSDLGLALNKTALKGPILKRFPNTTEDELTSLLEALNPSNKRVTFRTRYDAAVSKNLVEDENFSKEDAEKLFDKLLEGEDKKANKVKNKDLYVAHYFTFGRNLLLAKAEHDSKAESKAA